MKSIAKYQVIGELGSSATGKCYRARDVFRNREFAVKVLQTVPGLSDDAKQQFCAQLALCAELTHRHIAKIQDMGEVEEGIFVATEWRSGMDLRRFIAQNGDLALDQKLALVAQVAEGLAFAHSRGIAHGDLKRSNILVDAARDVSILDFGIAPWLAHLLNAGCHPEGQVAKYLAPEQILGQPFDARSDIFALGLILYEFVSGKYPFSVDPGLIPREIVHSEPEPLRKLDAKIPEELEQLVTRALDKQPEQRLQTAEEFAAGLYLAAQQLRRAASGVAAAETAPETAGGQTAAETVPPPVAPAAVLEPASSPSKPVKPAPEPALLSPAFTPASTLEIPGTPRERPQSTEAEQRPWTARSYAASRHITKEMPAYRPSAPVNSADPPKPRVAPPPASPAHEYRPPEQAFQPPQSFLRPSDLINQIAPQEVPKKAGKLTAHLLIAVAGLILAASLAGTFVSRQNLRASEKRHAITHGTEPVAPVVKSPAPAAAPPPPPPSSSGH